VITSILAVVPVGVYVAWQVATGTTKPAGRLIVHGEPVKVPVPLLVNVTVPVGTMPVPVSVSLTSAVQVVIEPKLIEAGMHVTVVVVVRSEVRTVRGSQPLTAPLLFPSPEYNAFQLKLPAVLKACDAELGTTPFVTVTGLPTRLAVPLQVEPVKKR